MKSKVVAHSTPSLSLYLTLYHPDYLIPQVKKMRIPSSAWKHIMMQIGANDLCQLCLQGTLPGPADDFEEKIRAVLEYLRENLRVFVFCCYFAWT